MKQKEFILINKGMRRDLSVSKAGESSAYENRNVRITATDKDTLLSVTNERGNRDAGVVFEGVLVGYGVLNEFVLLFTEDNGISRIYRAELYDYTFRTILIFSGKLGFSADYPIETLVDYETDDVQKIYWLDGKHVLRFLNFSDSSLKKHLVSGDLYNDPVFDFAEDITWFDSDRPSSSAPSVTITKDNGGNSRANGVAQYFMTYYNKNGQQTGIIWSSPLIYLSPDGRGGAADGSNSNRITVTASEIDNTFDYARLYMIVRTSLDGQTTGYIVGESSVSEGKAVFVDDGSHLETSDPASFIFLGGSGVIAGTMAQKDGTLFLGNLTSIGKTGTQKIEEAIRDTAFYLTGDRFKYGKDWESAIVSFRYSSSKVSDDKRCHIPYVLADGYYPYESQLKYTNAQISTFKGGEKYRFALRFIKGNGTMSKPFWIGDRVNPYYPKMRSDYSVSRVIAECIVPDTVIQAASADGYVSAQLMIAQATYADRSVKAQGIVSPTMFNLFRRTYGLTYAQSSWMYRMRGGDCPSRHLDTLTRSDSPYAEMQCAWWPDNSTVPSALYCTDSSGKFVTTPYGYTEFTALRIIVTIEARKAGGKMALVRFYAKYYRNVDDVEASKTYEYMLTPSAWWGWGQLKDKIVANWLSAYESADVPAEYRVTAGFMYSKLDEAMGKATNFKPYTLTYANPSEDGKILLDFTTRDASKLYAKLNREYYFVDENVVTLNSPEISYGAVSLDRNSSIKFRIVGVARMTANISDFSVNVTDGEYPSGPKMPCLLSNVNVTDKCSGLSAWPLIAEYGYRKVNENQYEQVQAPYAYMAYMWQKTGSVPAFGTDNTQWSKLSNKIVANLRYSHWTIYNDYKNGSWDVSPSDIRQLTGLGAKLYEMRLGSNTVTYSADIDELVTMPDNTDYPVFFSLQDAAKGQQLQISSAKNVNDPVHLTYKSDAHTVIALPDNDGKSTILPYMRETERFSLDDVVGNGPYAPWSGESSLSGRTLIYREVDSVEEHVSNLSFGSYGPFKKLSETTSSGIVIMRASLADMGSSAVSDFNRMTSYVGKSYPGRTVYACLKATDGSVLLVDISGAKTASVQVRLYREPVLNLISIRFVSAIAMSSVRLVFYDESGQKTHDVTDTVIGTGTDYMFKEKPSKLGNFSKVGFVVSFAATYTSSDGSTQPVVPALDKTGADDRLAAGSSAFSITNYAEYIAVDGLYINPETNTSEIKFADVSSSPVRFYILDEKHKMTYSGRYSPEYKSPLQSKFSLSDKKLFTNDCPYLYVGELYHDFDSEAENKPELDTRYGGISESAVEGNTFIEAGSRTLLTESEDRDSYAKTELDCSALYDYIYNESNLQSSDFKLPVELSGKAGIAETITLRSLNAISISDILPTSTNKCSGLSIKHDEDGTWKSMIAGMPAARVALLAQDPTYTVAILRNGYARRGKWKKYINKYGILQSTHTERDSRYKKMRCGYANGLPTRRMRIIGYDLMICSDINAMKETSCTWGVGDTRINYNTATLVSSLGTALVLPQPKKYSVTRDGRFSSRSSKDLVELFIGLYHYEDGQWKLASNIVQVRGRASDNTKIWEFDKENIVQTATQKEKTSTV